MKPSKQSVPLRAMQVAGIMSGTSADGIDVAIVKIRPHGSDIGLKFIGHAGFPFSSPLRKAILAAMDAKSITTAELARLNWRLGQAYAEALTSTLEQVPCRLDLVGCHGQTIYHQSEASKYLGREIRCTWQIGEMALLARASGVPVVSNFRPADMVVGGQGAPLVSLLDYSLFRHKQRGRVLQNLGGIGNLTCLLPDAREQDVLAFDTGPGNMVIDQLMQKLFSKRFDAGGRIAGKGAVLDAVITAMLRDPFFSQAPPKSAGREQFGSAYAERFLAACRRISKRPEDAVASATALTAASVKKAFMDQVKPRMGSAAIDFLCSGGGSRNQTLMRMLREALEPLGCSVKPIDALGLPTEAKEAAAFALLAYQTWHRRQGNLPAATGARSAALLGQIAYV